MAYAENVMINVLKSLYMHLGASVLLAFLFMFYYMYLRRYGINGAFNKWLYKFKSDSDFRRTFFLVFYGAMILFRTLLCRSVYNNPVSNVIGIWGLHDKEGKLNTESLENLILFVPFSFLLFYTFRDRFFKQNSMTLISVMRKSVVIIFSFSLLIETCQLFMKLGTFQLSDLFYNTLGGLIGGILYYITAKK